MPPEWEAVTLGEVLSIFAALVVVVGGLVLLFRWMQPIMVKLTRVFDLILGVKGEPGIPDRPGMAERLDEQDAKLATIHALVEDSGKTFSAFMAESVKDRTDLRDRTERFMLDSQADRLSLRRSLEAVEREQRNSGH